MPNAHPYRLGRDHGAWRRGEIVRLDDDTAGLLTRANGPGLLIPVSSDEPIDQPAPTARAIEAPPSDRMQRGRSNRGAPKPPKPTPEPKRRKDRAGDPGDQGAMSKADHPALLRGGA